MRKIAFGFMSVLGVASVALATPVWTASDYAKTIALAENNLLRTVGVTYDFLDNANAWDHQYHDNLSSLSDGKLYWNAGNLKGYSYSVGNNSKFEAVFPRAARVDSLRFLTFNGGRDGVNVQSIWVKRSATGAYEQLVDVVPCSVGVQGVTDTHTYTGSNQCCLTLADEAGALAEGIYAFRVDFGTMDNAGTLMDEIELCGELSAATSFRVVFLDRDGTTALKDVTLTPGDTVTAPEIPTHDGYFFLGWDKDFSSVNTDLTIQSLWWASSTPRWTQTWWFAGGSWYTGPSPMVTLADNNLLSVVGVTSVFTDNNNRLVTDTRFEDPSCLWNHTLDVNVGTANKTYLIGDNAKLVVTFPRATDLSAINLLSWCNSPNYDGIHVKSIFVKKSKDGAFEDLGVVPYSIAVNGVTDGENAVEGSGGLGNKSKQAYRVSLACPDGALLAKDIFALRIDFGKMDNNGTNMEEIEVLGTISEATGFHIVFLDMDGTTVLKEVDIKPGEAVTAPETPAHAGYAFLGWDTDFSTINSDLTIHSTWVEAGQPVWTTGPWTDQRLPHSYTTKAKRWNLMSLPGVVITEICNDATSGESATRRDTSVITTGLSSKGSNNQTEYNIGNNTKLGITFAEPATLNDIHIFSRWGNGGRDAFEVNAIYVRMKGAAEFVKLEKVAKFVSDGFNNNGSAGRLYAYLACPDGVDLADGLVAEVRIEFGNVDNGYIGIDEIMMTGIPESTIQKDLTLTGRARANAADVETVPEGLTNLCGFVSQIAVEYNNLTDGGMKLLTNTVVLLDGAYPFAGSYETCFGISDNAVLRFDFDRAIDLSAINLYSYWGGGGRNGTGIADVYVRPAGKTAYRRYLIEESLSYDKSGSDGLVATLKVEGDTIAEGVDSVRIVFGTEENNGTGYQEIEFVGCKSPQKGLLVIIR